MVKPQFRMLDPQPTRRSILRAAALFLTAAVLSHTVQSQPPSKKGLPLPGETWSLEGREAFVISPAKPQPGATPWVWYAPTLPGLPGAAEKWMFEKFTAAGIAVAGIDVGESYGSPRGRALFSALYRELTVTRGFAPKPVLLGRSRGGLMALNWAADNPDKVGGFAGVYPVCNLASYPGLAKACGAYEMGEAELKEKLTEHNPIERLAPLARAGVPLFAIHGDSDRVVPLEANSGEVHRRYHNLGGKMQLIVPKSQGHNMWEGFFQNQELVDFVMANARP
jgi:pimeloyl-ACP methyl ester carboxylesterase